MRLETAVVGKVYNRRHEVLIYQACLFLFGQSGSMYRGNSFTIWPGVGIYPMIWARIRYVLLSPFSTLGRKTMLPDTLSPLIDAIFKGEFFGELGQDVKKETLVGAGKKVREARAFANRQLDSLAGVTGKEGVYRPEILEEMKTQVPESREEIEAYEGIIRRADEFLKLMGKNARGQNTIAQRIKERGYAIISHTENETPQPNSPARKIKVNTMYGGPPFYIEVDWEETA